MYIEPKSASQLFSEKQKAVFLKYCILLRKYGSYAKNIDRNLIYREVAEAMMYKNHESVAHIISKMLKSGYSVREDIDTKECREKLSDLEKLKSQLDELNGVNR